jgi:hypothetical protein
VVVVVGWGVGGVWKGRTSSKSARKAATASSWRVPYSSALSFSCIVLKSIGVSTTVWYDVSSAYSAVTGSAKNLSWSSRCSVSRTCVSSVPVRSPRQLGHVYFCSSAHSSSAFPSSPSQCACTQNWHLSHCTIALSVLLL